MARSLLIRGMLVGLLAGLLMFGFGKIFGEPQVDRAIAFETAENGAKAAAQHHAEEAAHPGAAHTEAAAEEEELFSRGTQAGVGLLTGVVVYGAAFGGLFALVFAYAFGRVGPADPRALAALLAFGGFLAITLVPMIIYPANPPAVGDGETIQLRTGFYFLALLVSIVAVVTGIKLRTQLMRATDAWTATLSAIGVYVGIVLVAALLLPTIDEVPLDFPASLLWKFRVSSLGLQVVMWSTLGLGFGYAAERLLAPRRSFAIGGQAQTLVR